ncbi:MAG: DegT/DnrJ/EryC1/StrS family aminotransferase [Thermoplasmatales archaeon]|nr:DegT/DnrJ/EryC1/StrS family aminotransferase [Thermoplasmatales archaeon]
MKKPSDMKSNIIEEYPVGTIFNEEEIDAIRRMLDSGVSLTRGPDVELFEKEFAQYCGAKHAIAISSCGAALRIAMQVLHLTSNDEVICQANAFWQTIVSLLERNVKIKCADIDPTTLNIDPDKIEPLITKKTKAIYLVHHGGNPADLKPIREIAEKHGLVVVEDSAHAAGAEYKGHKIGYNSDISCFSFSTLKNISTLGEGGMFVTNNKEYADMAWGLRTGYPYGKRVKRKTSDIGDYPKPKSPVFMHAGDAWDYNWIRVDEVGTTYRLSTPQAAVGRVQLKKLDKHIAMREDIAKGYNKAIEDINGLRTVRILPGCKHAWHLYTFFLNANIGINRNEFVKYLEDKYNIHIVIRFWPINLGGIMRMHGHYLGECPVCEHVWFKEQLGLPISPQMQKWEINTIVKALFETMKTLKKKN